MGKKLRKRIGCLMAVLCLFVLECSSMSAKELPVFITQQTTLEDLIKYDTDGDGMVTGIIVGTEPTSDISNDGIRLRSLVGDNGVRLRKAPSTSSTILELMYEGEKVIVNYTVSLQLDGWYYLQRVNTGTWGYASSLYIAL